MSYKSKLSGFNRIKWENKTTSQKQDLLKNHYQNLGYNIPKYLEGKNLTDKALNGAINKINKGYKSRTKAPKTNIKNPRTRTKKPQSKNDYLARLDKTITKHNNQVRKTIKHFKGKTSYSEKALEYIMGYGINVSVSKNMVHKDLNTLGFENLKFNSNFFVKDNSFIEKEIKRIENETKLKTPSNYKKYLDSEKDSNIEFMKDFLNDEYLDSVDDETKEHILYKFNQLNSIQMDVSVKSALEELRDRYLKMLEQGLIDEKTANDIIARIDRIIDSIKEEV